MEILKLEYIFLGKLPFILVRSPDGSAMWKKEYQFLLSHYTV